MNTAAEQKVFDDAIAAGYDRRARLRGVHLPCDGDVDRRARAILAAHGKAVTAEAYADACTIALSERSDAPYVGLNGKPITEEIIRAQAERLVDEVGGSQDTWEAEICLGFEQGPSVELVSALRKAASPAMANADAVARGWDLPRDKDGCLL
jgi:hypothetical protein